MAGNPALSFGGATEVATALADLDLLVCVDLYRNATGELADINLPATDWFERPDLNTFTQGVQAIPHIQLTEALVEPRAERKPEAEIFALLSEAMGFPAAFGPGTDAIAMMNDGDLAAHGLSVAELAGRDRGLAVLDPRPHRRVPRGPAAVARRADRLRPRAGGRATGASRRDLRRAGRRIARPAATDHPANPQHAQLRPRQRREAEVAG